MKLLFLLYAMLFSTIDPSDCQSFYNKTLKPIHFDGYLVKKEKTEQLYILHIEDKKDKHLTVVQLLKNETGRSIYLFAKDSCWISKKENRLDIHVVVPIHDGYNVRVFQDLCE